MRYDMFTYIYAGAMGTRRPHSDKTSLSSAPALPAADQPLEADEKKDRNLAPDCVFTSHLKVLTAS